MHAWSRLPRGSGMGTSSILAGLAILIQRFRSASGPILEIGPDRQDPEIEESKVWILEINL